MFQITTKFMTCVRVWLKSTKTQVNIYRYSSLILKIPLKDTLGIKEGRLRSKCYFVCIYLLFAEKYFYVNRLRLHKSTVLTKNISLTFLPHNTKNIQFIITILYKPYYSLA